MSPPGGSHPAGNGPRPDKVFNGASALHAAVERAIATTRRLGEWGEQAGRELLCRSQPPQGRGRQADPESDGTDVIPRITADLGDAANAIAGRRVMRSIAWKACGCAGSPHHGPGAWLPRRHRI
jgi:hypothetical protein